MKNFKEVNCELNLDYIGGDWGIINGSADRVKEFIEYLGSNDDLIEDSTKFEFLELIISSMNEAILEDKVTNEINFFFKEYIYQHIDNKIYFETTLMYWMSIADKEEFPVGFLLLEIIEPTL